MATTDLNAFGEALDLSAQGMRFGLVISSWNSEITEALFQGCRDTLIDAGAANKDIERMDVPGSFELIFGASKLMSKAKFDAIVVIGSVIQGETRHFEFVCQGLVQGIAQLNTLGKVPIIFCVLTDDTLQQAKDRSGGEHGNKGVEAAAAAVRMAHLNQ